MTRRLIAILAAAALVGGCSTLSPTRDAADDVSQLQPIEPTERHAAATPPQEVSAVDEEPPVEAPAPVPSLAEQLEQRREIGRATGGPPREELKNLTRIRTESLVIIRGSNASHATTPAPKGGAARLPAGPPPPPGRFGGVQADTDLQANADDFTNYGVNPFTEAAQDRLSTFAVDVDTASYTIARRRILEGSLPPKDSVRVEEFLNYFRYAYPAPETAPFAVHMDAAPSPYNPGRHLLRVGVQGKRLSLAERKKAHLVFLVDVSGSMQSPDRLPLAKKSLRFLVDNLRDGDTVALVTYAGSVAEVLPPTGLEHKAKIHAAIEALSAGGSTAMSSGIELAYRNAMKTLSPDSNTRVIVLSDGDANVGNTSHEDILKMIKGYVSEGITLTTVGFGMGNYKDTTMEQLANKGNGNNFYIDSPMQARRVFQEQLGGTLEVIAQDVKLQVEFNPERVKRYRLVGYENRNIRDQDFRNDRVDAGEIGSGHSVTALYEVELTGEGGADSLATVRIRAKKPRGEKATETAYVFDGRRLAPRFEDAPEDLRFAAAVMGAAEIFRQSPHAKGWSLEQVARIARGATPPGNHERQEFCTLVETAKNVVGRVAAR
ncbi:MAG: vWA domain-containing protein [Myxococcales bacterium]